MKFGYARVSTEDQNLDLQLIALSEYGCDEIIKEKMSGKRDDRPELNNLLSKLRKGDKIVVYKLDRLGRRTSKLIEMIEDFQKEGIEFVSIRDSIDTTSAMGKAMFKIMAVLAEMERDLTAERTKAGLAAARARGKKLGRPPAEPKKVKTAIMMHQSGDYSIEDICQTLKISRMTLYRYLKKQDQPV